MQKYRYIDALRGIAVLMVIFHHNWQGVVYRDFRHYPSWFSTLGNLGSSGVQLFFVLSCFTLFLSYKNRTNTEKRPITNFYIRRFFRIAPMFYFCILIYSFLEPKRISAAYLLANVTLIFGVHPYGFWSLVPYGWSIGTEVLFYLIFPLLFQLLSTLKRSILTTLILALIATIANNSFLASINVINNFYPINQASLTAYLEKSIICTIPIFLLGSILFHLIAQPKLSIFNIKIYLTILISCIIIILITKQPILFQTQFVLGVIFLILIFFLSINTKNILINKVTTEVGTLSYSMYLLHYFAMHILKLLSLDLLISNAVFNATSRYLILTILTYCLAKLAHLVIENPGIKLGKSIISILEKRLPASAISSQHD